MDQLISCISASVILFCPAYFHIFCVSCVSVLFSVMFIVLIFAGDKCFDTGWLIQARWESRRIKPSAGGDILIALISSCVCCLSIDATVVLFVS